MLDTTVQKLEIKQREHEIGLEANESLSKEVISLKDERKKLIKGLQDIKEKATCATGGLKRKIDNGYNSMLEKLLSDDDDDDASLICADATVDRYAKEIAVPASGGDDNHSDHEQTDDGQEDQLNANYDIIKQLTKRRSRQPDRELFCKSAKNELVSDDGDDDTSEFNISCDDHDNDNDNGGVDESEDEEPKVIFDGKRNRPKCRVKKCNTRVVEGGLKRKIDNGSRQAEIELSDDDDDDAKVCLESDDFRLNPDGSENRQRFNSKRFKPSCFFHRCTAYSRSTTRRGRCGLCLCKNHLNPLANLNIELNNMENDEMVFNGKTTVKDMVNNAKMALPKKTVVNNAKMTLPIKTIVNNAKMALRLKKTKKRIPKT